MKKELTTVEIVALYHGLTELINMPELKMTPVDKYHMLRNKNVLESYAKDFDQARSSLILKYGDIVNEETGEYRIIDPEKYLGFVKDIDPIATEKNEVDLYEIDINSLNDENIKTTIIEAMMPIIVEK